MRKEVTLKRNKGAGAQPPHQAVARGINSSPTTAPHDTSDKVFQ